MSLIRPNGFINIQIQAKWDFIVVVVVVVWDMFLLFFVLFCIVLLCFVLGFVCFGLVWFGLCCST